MTPYPIILCGDHAAFEAEWAASGKPDNERPDWPLPSFDAQDWAAAFCKIANELGFKDAKSEPIDEGWMIGWFANALRRGYDEAREDYRVAAAEVGRLRSALHNIELRYDTDSDPYEMVEIARAALEPKP